MTGGRIWGANQSGRGMTGGQILSAGHTGTGGLVYQRREVTCSLHHACDPVVTNLGSPSRQKHV
eukprot:CAMPEP_0174885842 /NCGR_PEP_ID=MMETSP0167-20121228/1112_1 /TAXON_ID=38298 /ORGANISM="Rhodella maculata, Strain CCMP736" /LENGTH=63 /DNA_ID=CAMNT_0016121569 /DNA_START=106 /DNA_END=294 /DNA_ORIENTATION=-